MPVRVKSRALQGDKSSFNRDWDRLLLDLVAIILFWPGEISLSIREVSGRQSLSLRTGSRSRTWLNDGIRLLHQASLCNSPDTSDWVPIGASASRLSIDGYVCREPVATKRVQFISLGIEPLTNVSRCNVLFEEVNRVFADSAFGALDTGSGSDGDLQKPKMEGFTGKELKTRKGVDRWPMFFLRITGLNWTTGRSRDLEDVLDDRHPDLSLITDLLRATFYEFLKENNCQPKKVNLSVKQKPSRHQHPKSDGKLQAVKSSSRSISDLASSPVEKPARKTRRLESPESRSESPFDGWSRIKSGQTLPTFKDSTQSSSRSVSLPLPASSAKGGHDSHSADTTMWWEPPPAEHSQPPLYDANGKLTRKPFEDIDPRHLKGGGLSQRASLQEKAPKSSTGLPRDSAKDELIEWINPATKMATLVDSRTGFVMPPNPLTLSRRAAKQAAQAGNADQNAHTAPSTTTPWLKDLVGRWENPVFQLTNRPIPKLPDCSDMLDMDVKAGGHHCDHDLSALSMGTYYEASAMGLRGRISRAGLRAAELVAQVDNKFILVKVPFSEVPDRSKTQTSSTSSCMVLVDQHAADERCRVESLMKDYFLYRASSNRWEAVTELLPKPLFFELSRQDRNVLCRAQGYLSDWGLCYDVESPGSGQSFGGRKPTNNGIGPKARVAVRSLPPAILERCRTEPGLLSNLIRTEAWKLNDDPGPAQLPRTKPVLPEGAEENSPAWVSLFHGCPQGIIELINSRSCRSAIMFNDPLTRDQCTGLLERLVECAFPFQCAHGRPSMVPLVDLGGALGQIESSPEGREPAFGRKFKLWKNQK
jgi:DNA mismatch repair protein MLH3